MIGLASFAMEMKRRADIEAADPWTKIADGHCESHRLAGLAGCDDPEWDRNQEEMIQINDQCLRADGWTWNYSGRSIQFTRPDARFVRDWLTKVLDLKPE